ncbi:MAG: hypothetical protein ACOZQL_21070 [Myxococcota bacterium]
MSWRHPVVRGFALLITAASIALMFFPEVVGLPLLRFPLWAQFVVGTLVVLAPILELLARFLPRE